MLRVGIVLLVLVRCTKFSESGKATLQHNSLYEEKPNNADNNQETRKTKRNYVIPNKVYCGRQHWDDYFHLKNETIVSVDQFPWLVAFQYPKLVGTGVCYASAVLISTRYVLALDSCMEHKGLKAVLGQHDRYNNVSCTQTDIGIDDCTDPKQVVNITEVIRYLDTGLILIRLEETIIFTDYVRPVCLPTEELDLPKRGDTLTTSGWAFYKGEELPSLKYKYPCTIQDYDACGNLDTFIEGNIIKKVHIRCENVNLHHSRAAGPMMYRNKQLNWFIESFPLHFLINNNRTTVESCAEQVTPELISWLLETMHN